MPIEGVTPELLDTVMGDMIASEMPFFEAEGDGDNWPDWKAMSGVVRECVKRQSPAGIAIQNVVLTCLAEGPQAIACFNVKAVILGFRLAEALLQVKSLDQSVQ